MNFPIRLSRSIIAHLWASCGKASFRGNMDSVRYFVRCIHTEVFRKVSTFVSQTNGLPTKSVEYSMSFPIRSVVFRMENYPILKPFLRFVLENRDLASFELYKVGNRCLPSPGQSVPVYQMFIAHISVSAFLCWLVDRPSQKWLELTTKWQKGWSEPAAGGLEQWASPCNL